MSARSALLAGRRRAESLMVDTLSITRPSGEVDPFTGQPINPEPVYEGRGKIQTFRPHESLPEAGGAQWVTQRYEAHLPVDAGPVRADDTVEVVASVNPHLVGRRYRVAAPDVKSMQTAQRVGIVEVVR